MTARTLREFLADPAGDGQPAPRDLAALIEAISDSCRTISYLVSRGALAGVLGTAGTGNVQGEEQKQLDILANDELMAMAKASCVVAAAASVQRLEHATRREADDCKRLRDVGRRVVVRLRDKVGPRNIAGGRAHECRPRLL